MFAAGKKILSAVIDKNIKFNLKKAVLKKAAFFYAIKDGLSVISWYLITSFAK